MTKLNDLYDNCNQSPWVDNLKRSYITKGTLEQMIKDGVRGVTSNPSIFQKSISEGSDYDEQFHQLAADNSVEDAYWGLVVKDVSDACDVMRKVYDQSGGNDGFVSIEVSPALATEERATTEAARKFHTDINKPNLMVKIPATVPCIASIQQMIAEGRNINITLIFSIERYDAVIEAYIKGLEQYVESGATDLSNVNSVASFFVSRVDTEVDRRLAKAGTPEAKALEGKAAVAQAKLAYKLFEERFTGPRWEALKAKGAKVQRPLWASTSTKNPAYPDLLYVDTLIGPTSVNTMPDAVIEAFKDHGTVQRTVDTGVDEAQRAMDDLAKVGVDMTDVGRTLESEGVTAFMKAYDELLQVLADKYEALRESHRQEN